MSNRMGGAIGLLDMMQGFLDLALKITGAVVLLITGYYLFGIVFHPDQLFAGAGGTGQMSSADFQRHLGNMQMLTQVLLWVSAATVLFAVGRFYAFAETGLALLVFGAALVWGIPMLVDSKIAEMGIRGLPKALQAFGNPSAILKDRFAFAGLEFAVVGVLDLLVHGIAYAVTAKSRRPQANPEAAKTAAQVKKLQDQFLGPCWNLPFCRDTEKKMCPIRTNKKPCWRTGRGCYCDQNIVLTLSGGNAYQASRGSSGYLSRTSTVARPKTLAERRAQCLGCPIYLHHQSQKYKLMAPGVLLLAGLGFFLFRATILSLYPNAMLSLGRSLKGFSYAATSPGALPTWATELAANQGIMWMVLFLLGLMLIAYLLHGVEWVLYRLGI